MATQREFARPHPGWVLLVREVLSEHERAMVRQPVRTSFAVAALVRPRICREVVEVMYVLCLDAKSHVTCVSEIARGTTSSVSMSARDALRLPFITAARALILVHNHPSGDPTPSSEDLHLTRLVQDAGNAVELPLVDHVIVCAEKHYSFMDAGILPRLE